MDSSMFSCGLLCERGVQLGRCCPQSAQPLLPTAFGQGDKAAAGLAGTAVPDARGLSGWEVPLFLATSMWEIHCCTGAGVSCSCLFLINWEKIYTASVFIISAI